MQGKTHMIISKDAETALDKIQHRFTIENLNKLFIEEIYLNVIKASYKNPTTSIILNGEKLTVFL